MIQLKVSLIIPANLVIMSRHQPTFRRRDYNDPNLSGPYKNQALETLKQRSLWDCEHDELSCTTLRLMKLLISITAACWQLHFQGLFIEELRVNNTTDSPLSHGELSEEKLNNIVTITLSLPGQGPHYTIQQAHYSIIIVISLVKTYSRFVILLICIHIHI